MPRQPPEIIELIDPKADLDEKIYHLRVGGMAFWRIAKELDLTLARVASHYQNYLAYLARFSPHTDNREAEINLELDRLDRIQEAFWPMIVNDDPDVNAAKVVLEVMKHRSKLKGWDALDPQDAVSMQKVLIVGANQQAFLEALESGQRPALTSTRPDNEEGDVVVVESEVSR